MLNTPIIEFDLEEKREEGFKPWIDAGNTDLKANAFFKRAYYYTRAEHHGLYAGFAELRAFDGRIDDHPVDLFLIVIAGEIEISDAGGQVTRLRARDTAAVPRHLSCHWKQSDDSRVFFMLYDGTSKPAEPASPLSVVVPNLSDPLDPIAGPAPELIVTSPPPKVGRKVIYTDSTGQFTVGLWEATAYTRKLAAFKDYEIMHLIEGQVEITNAIGEARLFRAQEPFIVNRGVSNAWRSEGYVRKVYCKFSPNA
jgi:uncharacterized cupin superfamily protein